VSEELSPPSPSGPGRIPRPWQPEHLKATDSAKELVGLIYQFQQEFPSVLLELHLRTHKPDEIEPPSDMLMAILNDISYLAAARRVKPVQTTSDPELSAFVTHQDLGRQLERSSLMLKRFLRLEQELRRPVHPSSIGEYRRGLFVAQDEQLLEILDALDTLAQLLSAVVAVMRHKRGRQQTPAS
jgi:hypothetical protein